MIVRTFTHVWNMRVRLYAIDDIRLPIRNGVSILQLVSGLVAGLVWIPFCLAVGAQYWFGNLGITIMLFAGPPFFVLLNADRPIAHEKTTEEWLVSCLAHRAEPTRLATMMPAERPRPVLLTASRWIPDADVD